MDQSRSEPAGGMKPIVLLAVTGIAGFYLGCAVHGTWQAGLETAQVLAGIVKYPPWNPFYIYHVKLWSLINQLPAAALWAGATETQLSLVISGIIGMLFFQAMALIVWSLSRSLVLAFCAPFIMYLYVTDGYFSPFRRFFDSTVYPIFFMGEKHTYGGISLAYVLFVYALIGSGYLRAGSLCAGLAPAVHPSMGGLTLVVVAAVLLHERRSLSDMRGIALSGMLGLSLAAVSLLIQLFYMRTIDAPAMGPQASEFYMRTFARNNDIHRQPVNLVSWGMLAHFAVISLVVAALKTFRGGPGPSARILLKALLVTTVLSLVLCLLGHLPERLPLWLLMIMPGRLQNVVLVSLPLLVMGVSGRGMRDSFVHALPAAAMAAGMTYVSAAGIAIEANIIPVAASAGSIIAAGIAALLKERALPTLNAAGRGIVFVAAGLGVVYAAPRFADIQETWTYRKGSLIDWSNSGGYDFIRRAGGEVLLTSSDMAMQLVTRRAVLLNGGALNQVAYASEAAPVTDQILRDIYGVVLFSDETVERGGALTHECAKDLWEARTAEQWIDLASRYGFSRILTYPDWRLNLPGRTIPVEFGVAYNLYDIPGVAP